MSAAAVASLIDRLEAVEMRIGNALADTGVPPHAWIEFHRAKHDLGDVRRNLLGYALADIALETIP